jgi:predicted ATPase
MEKAPGNLRPATTSIIGRESEIADLHAGLKVHRFITLIGFGGVGKTRLATEVAARVAGEFLDGVWFFDLAAVIDPAAVPEAVAAVLGITQQAGKTVSESVAASLEGRFRLLVFDNCEHVRDAAADLIEAILVASTSVTILATSREGLGIANEQIWPVPSLDVETAVDLFIERAHRVAPASSAHDSSAVAEICRRLDGIPLAIELAASRMATMTAIEVRDRLDQRFRLLIGSRRAVERHQTLRHTVAWSYALLDESERVLLERCSVFAGGFDLEGACAVTHSDDDLATLDLLDALRNKSMIIVKGSTGWTRFSMLETIRQFAEEKLVASGHWESTRDAHAHYFADSEADVLGIWDSPHQREAFVWLSTELANLRAAFRWAAARGDLDSAAAIAVYTGFVGGFVEQHEPSTWAEEVIDDARTVGHRRLGQLYVIAAECYRTGRVREGVEYADKGAAIVGTDPYEPMLFDFEPTALGGTYITVGSGDRWLALCRRQLAQGQGMHAFNRGSMVMALATEGALEEAKSASTDLLDAAETTNNPGAQAFALLAYGYAWRETNPTAAYEALRRGLTIAQQSGNRMTESYLAVNLSGFGVTHGNPMDALDYLTLAIKNFFDTGSYSHMVSPLAVLAAHFDRIGRYEAAATMVGFAITAFALATFPEIQVAAAHLREVLGDNLYRSLSETGAKMTNAGAARYALEQIDQARAELNEVGPS